MIKICREAAYLNKALQPTPGDRRGRIEGLGRARLTFCR
jgi:hypothetical protein